MLHTHIVIPVYNQWSLTAKSLATLADVLHQDTTLTEHTFTITVVDDGSTDETRTKLAKTGTQFFKETFSTLRLEKNKGFAAACNAGAEQQTKNSTPDFIFFLHNDVELTVGSFAPLLQALQSNPKLGAVSPLLLYPDSGRVQHCGYAFTPSLRSTHLFANLPAMHPAVQHPKKLQAISAAAMLTRYSLFKECGGFHEGFCNGYEDIDFCARIRAKKFFVTVETSCHMLHTEQQTIKTLRTAPKNSKTEDSPTSKLNILLLNERTKGDFGPDLHRFAKQAGLEIDISPWLESYIKLPVAKEQALTLPFLEAFNPSACWQQLQEEPLWFTGYEILCNYLANNNMFAELCGARLLQSTHFPMLPVYIALQDAANICGNEELANQTGDKIANITELLEDPGPLIKKAAGMVNWAKKADEPELKKLFEDWLKDIGML